MNSEPTSDMLLEIRTVRQQFRLAAGCGGQCGDVAEYICSRWGWANVGGVYLAPSLEPIGDHVWNVLPDGSILDATADQFSEGHDVRFLLKDSPDFRRYRPEWTIDYNPDLADAYPELAGVTWSQEYDFDVSRRIRAQRGEGWWLPDPSDYRHWDPVAGCYAEPASSTPATSATQP
ncbi:hypothetical protein ACVIGB_001122 [Bradyrhizobium sp. USDA 4341]